MTEVEMKERTKAFALRVIKVAGTVRNEGAPHVGTTVGSTIMKGENDDVTPQTFFAPVSTEVVISTQDEPLK